MSIFSSMPFPCVPGRREVIQMTRDEYNRIPRERIHQASVIIVDGRMLKNRDGSIGTNIEGSLFVWDEVEVLLPYFRGETVM